MNGSNSSAIALAVLRHKQKFSIYLLILYRYCLLDLQISRLLFWRMTIYVYTETYDAIKWLLFYLQSVLIETEKNNICLFD